MRCPLAQRRHERLKTCFDGRALDERGPIPSLDHGAREDEVRQTDEPLEGRRRVDDGCITGVH
jgi:hypothetical protein